MTHYHIHEIDIDVEDGIDANQVDNQVTRVVEPLALAFGESEEDLGATFRALMKDMLRQFLGTHKSIRLLMKNREENPSGMADAMSLAREQIEKVYAVALLLENPEVWTVRYLKDAWRKSYEAHLIRAHEGFGLASQKEFLDWQSGELGKERRIMGITDEEEEFVEWNFENPPWLAEGKREIPEHLTKAKNTIATFPTPGAALRKISDVGLKRALVRLYREYGYLSAYSHAGFEKLMPSLMEANMKLSGSQKQKVIETEYAKSIAFSYLATGMACAEAATRELPRGPTGSSGPPRRVADAQLLVKLSELWDLLQRGSLVGRSLYEMRASHLLPPTVGGA